MVNAVQFQVSGTDVMIFKYFRRKIWRENQRFLLQLELVLAKKLITTLVFKKRQFFSQKIGKNRRKL
jgi:hypothetical protein